MKTNSHHWLTAVLTVLGSSLSAFFGSYLAVSSSLARFEMEQGRQRALSAVMDGTSMLTFSDTSSDVEDEKQAAPPLRSEVEGLSEPARLPQSVPAIAVSTSNKAETKHKQLRSIVREELPNAKPEEIDIWSQELKGLSPETVREILRLRRKMGHPINGTEGIKDFSAQETTSASSVRHDQELRSVHYIDLH